MTAIISKYKAKIKTRRHKVFVPEKRVRKICKKAKEIAKFYNPNDPRSYEKRLENSFRGLLYQEAVKILIGLEDNPLEHDKTNPDSYSSDLVGEEGERIEVKSGSISRLQNKNNDQGCCDVGKYIRSPLHGIDLFIFGRMLSLEDYPGKGTEVEIRIDDLIDGGSFTHIEHGGQISPGDPQKNIAPFFYRDDIASKRGLCYSFRKP